MKKYICSICKKKYEAEYRPIHRTCGSVECLAKRAEKNLLKAKANRKKRTRAAKVKMRQESRSYWAKRAQTAVNAYVRARDKDDPCISCGYIGNGRQWHAGHYRPAGNHTGLRFNLCNIHKQCSICNNYKSGNLIGYRENLIRKIGMEKVEKLELHNEPKKYDIDYLKRIEAIFKKKYNILLDKY